MMNVHAPFNFVPLSQKVFYPDWADKISQDIPFEDGKSGRIDLTITAKTPIFTTDGHSLKDEDKKEPERAAKTPDGKFYLPATSVKGCIRNVLEILGNCKMMVDPKARFAQREWKNTKLYTLKDEQKDIKGGWLSITPGEDGQYELKECKVYRIGLDQIDAMLGESVMRQNFDGGGKLPDEKKIAKYKYEKLIGDKISKLRNKHFRVVADGPVWKRVKPAGDGEIRGTVVLTGQPNKSVLWGEDAREGRNRLGKFYEFVFDENIKATHRIPTEIYEQYDEFIYKDNEDWKYAKKKLGDPRGIPVFFSLKNGKVKDFGLALLYKLPYERTPAEIEEDRRVKGKEEEPDLAECIFGYTLGDKSLRGRVQFSSFISDNATENEEITLILNGPKASYYPMYIAQLTNSQGVVNNYKTYNDGQLAGWKRYHVRENVWEKMMGNDKLDTTIRPIDKGAVFKGCIRFHNLKPEELGALLSAITFHNTPDCYHQIGKAKPYGYGKITINVDKLNLVDQEPIENPMQDESVKYMLAQFEECVNPDKSASTELVTIASTDVPDTEDYRYMTLEMNGTNEFSDAKGSDNDPKYALLRFSKHAGISPKHLSEDAMQSKKQQERKRAEEEKIKRQKELEQKEKEREQKEKEEKARKEKEEKERIAQQEAERLKKRGERQKNAINQGLASLEDDKNFNEIKTRVEKWLRDSKNSIIPDEQLKHLEKALNRVKDRCKRDIKKNQKWINTVSGGQITIEV